MRQAVSPLRRILLFMTVAVVGLGFGLPSTASATVVTGTSCVDGGGVTWKSKATWGTTYRDAAGTTRVQLDYAGWAATRAGRVPTDSAVKTYDGAGRLLQTLTLSAAFDYRSGTVYRARNPLNPPSAPGHAKVTVTTGVDGDGHGNCTVTFVQPRAAVAVPSGHVRKVLVIVEENHSLAQMKSGMPYLHSLATRYSYASHYTAIRHPSLPNYLAIAGGDTFGVTDDAAPASHPISSKTVFGQAFDHGFTARTYAETMSRNCLGTGNVAKGYAVKHNPWAYFTAERAACTTYDVPATGFKAAAASNALPNVGMLIPNKCHDAHDCSLGSADAWLKSQLPTVLASSDFTSGRLAVVVTADEDDSHAGNTVLTVVLHRSLKGKVVSKPLTHYSLSRLLSDTVGAAPLRHAATAPSLAAAFGLSVGP